jgi:hypothetical protein
MSELAAAILATALAASGPWYPPGEDPESPCERQQRYETIATALAVEAIELEDGWGWSAADRAWAGYVVTRHESGRWRLEVHDGSRRGDRGQSVCLGQIRHGDESLIGTSLEATRACVRAVYEHLAQHWERCLYYRPEPSAWAMGAVFAGYGTGHSCNPQHNSPHLGKGWALKRGRHWWQVRQ